MTIFHNRSLPLRGLACVALLVCGVAQAQTAATPLTHGGQFAITSTDIEADALMRMPPEMRPMVLSDAKTVARMVSNMYVRRGLAREAAVQGLEKDPQIAAQLQLARDKVLSDAMLTRIDAQNVPSDKAVLAQAEATYKAKPERFQVPEQVQARHILVAGTTPQARAQAEKLLADLKAGADFAKLAEENSADKGSAAKGGELGLVGKGQMVPPFEAAVFALQHKGDLSGVVETQFGYHIIQLEDRKPAHQRSFEEVKEALEKEVRASVAQDARVSAAQKLEQGMEPDTPAIEAFSARYAKEVPAAKK